MESMQEPVPPRGHLDVGSSWDDFYGETSLVFFTIFVSFSVFWGLAFLKYFSILLSHIKARFIALEKADRNGRFFLFFLVLR